MRVNLKASNVVCVGGGGGVATVLSSLDIRQAVNNLTTLPLKPKQLRGTPCFQSDERSNKPVLALVIHFYFLIAKATADLERAHPKLPGATEYVARAASALAHNNAHTNTKEPKMLEWLQKTDITLK